MTDNSFQTILTKVISECGVTILDTPAKCNGLLQDYANGEYKREIRLLLQALEAGYHKELLNSTDPEITMLMLVQKFHDDYGIAEEMAEETIKTLAIALFGKEKLQNKIYCKNCEKELQEEWVACPYCGTSIKDKMIVAVTSSGSGDFGYGISLIAEGIAAGKLKIGEVYNGTVKRFENDHVWVEILPGIEGTVHVSELSRQRIHRARDVVEKDQEIPVKLI